MSHMKSNKTIFIYWAIAVFISPVMAFDYSVPERWGYRQILEELEIRGKAPLIKESNPFSFQEVISLIDNISNERWREGHERQLILLDPLWDAVVFTNPSFESCFDGDPGRDVLVNRNYGGLFIGRGNLSMAGVYYMATGDEHNEKYYGKMWRGVSGGSDQIYLRYVFQNGYIQMGKDCLGIASGLALSGDRPFEKIQAEYRFNRNLSILAFTGQLDKMQDSQAIYNRYLSGHRAEIALGNVQIGLTELVIYGGAGRSIEPYYILPLYIFQAEQLNKLFIDDNVIWDMDIKAVVKPFRLRAEFMVDDFQIDSDSPTDNEPTEAGFLIRADWAALSRPFYLTPFVKYQMVTDWTFNQPKVWNHFIYEGLPLGTKYGNDYDRLSLGATTMGPRHKGTIELYHLRKGEGRVTADWTEPWVNDSSWQERFPRGMVEKTFGVGLQVSHHLGEMALQGIGGICCLKAEGSWEMIKNKENIPGITDENWKVCLGLDVNIWKEAFRIE